MLQRLKNKFVAGFVAVASLLGYQYHRPATYEVPDHIVKQVKTAKETPTPAPSNLTEEPTTKNFTLGLVTNEDGSPVSPEMMKMAQDSVDYDNAVTQDDCYQQGTLKKEFTENNDLTNGQILNLFTHKPITVNIQFFYGTYRQNYWYKTVGYDIGDGVVYANTFYVDNAKTLGSLDLHEIAHALGFTHYQVKDTSVPYGQNDLFDGCVK